MAAHQQIAAAWISAGAAVVQAAGAIAAIIVAVKLARDSERRAAAAEKAAADREIAAEKAAAARAEAADRAAEDRVAHALRSQRAEFIDTIAILARELLEDVDQEYEKAKNQFGSESFVGYVSGGHTPKRGPAIMELIPEWKLGARNGDLVRAISRFEQGIQGWKTPSGGIEGPSYVSLFKSKRDEIEAAIVAIESFGISDQSPE